MWLLCVATWKIQTAVVDLVYLCEISVTPLLCSSWHVKVSGVQVIQRRLAWQFVKDDTHKSNVPVAHTSGSKTRSEIGAVSAQL